VRGIEPVGVDRQSDRVVGTGIRHGGLVDLSYGRLGNGGASMLNGSDITGSGSWIVIIVVRDPGNGERLTQYRAVGNRYAAYGIHHAIGDGKIHIVGRIGNRAGSLIHDDGWMTPGIDVKAQIVPHLAFIRRDKGSDHGKGGPIPDIIGFVPGGIVVNEAAPAMGIKCCLAGFRPGIYGSVYRTVEIDIIVEIGISGALAF